MLHDFTTQPRSLPEPLLKPQAALKQAAGLPQKFVIEEAPLPHNMLSALAGAVQPHTFTPCG